MSGEDYKFKYLALLDAVSKARHLQKQYFKTRDKEVLQQSKKAEAELDKLILGQGTINF